MIADASDWKASERLSALRFGDEIERLIEDFRGREWIFANVDAWLRDPQGPGLFLLAGDPGIGKSAIAARLVQTRPDVIAHHFCIAGRVETIEPRTVLRSLAAQLAERVPGYGNALAATVKPSHLTINVRIDVETMSGGQITGVVIQHLASLDPQTELEVLLRAPLAALPPPPQSQLIVIDSLDEAATLSAHPTLVTLLADLNGLPSWLRILCTTRPVEPVTAYFHRAQLQILAAESRSNLEDIRDYMAYRMGKAGLKTRLTAAGTREADFVGHVAGAAGSEAGGLAAGNFLFVKMLLNEIEAGRQPLDDLAQLPRSLEEIYHQFLLRIEPEWARHYQPLFGVLAVAVAPLTEDQLARFTSRARTSLRQNLGLVRQFFDEGCSETGEPTFRLFHQSLRDYLLDEKRAGAFWCASEEQHARIAAYYRGSAKRWQDAAWEQVDDYGLMHLAAHLKAISGTQDWRGSLYDLLCPALMQAKRARFGSHRAFADDAALALNTAMAEKPLNLAAATKAGLVYATLGSLADAIPPSALATLARVGKAPDAIEHAELMTDPEQRCESYRLIAQALTAGDGRIPEVLEAALASAVQIPSEDQRANALTRLAGPLSQVGKLDGLRTACDDFTTDHGRSHGMAAIARAAALGPRGIEEVLALASQFGQSSLRAEVLCAAFPGLAGQGDAAGIDRLLADPAVLQDPSAAFWLHLAAANALSAVGRPAQAVEVCSRAAGFLASLQDEQDSRFAGLAESFGLGGDFDQAIAYLGRISPPEYQDAGRVKLVRLLAAAGRHQQAIAEAKKIAALPSRVVALSKAAQAEAEAGQVELAKATLNELGSGEIAVAPRAEIARALAVAGHKLEAVELALQCKAEIVKLRDERTKSRPISAVRNALSEQVKSLDNVSIPRALCNVAATLAHAGRFAEAREAADAISTTPLEDAGRRFRRGVTAKTDTGLAGWLIKMEALYLSVYENYLRSSALTALSIEQARVGRGAEGLLAAEAIPVPRWRVEALAAIAETLALQGDIVAAQGVAARPFSRGGVLLEDRAGLAAVLRIDRLLEETRGEPTASVADNAVGKLRHLIARPAQPASKQPAVRDLASAQQFARASSGSATRTDALYLGVSSVMTVLSLGLAIFGGAPSGVSGALRGFGMIISLLERTRAAWKAEAFCAVSDLLSRAETLSQAESSAGLMVDIIQALSADEENQQPIQRVLIGCQDMADQASRSAVLALTQQYRPAVQIALQMREPADQALALARIAFALALANQKEAATTEAGLAMGQLAGVNDDEARETIRHILGRTLALIQGRGWLLKGLSSATLYGMHLGDHLAATAEEDDAKGALVRRIGVNRMIRPRGAPASGMFQADSGAEVEPPNDARIAEEIVITLGLVPRYLLEQNDNSAALFFLPDIAARLSWVQDPGNRARVLADMASINVHVGSRAEALRLAREAMELAAGATMTAQRTALLINLAALFSALGERALAAEAANEALAQVVEEPDHSRRATLYASLAEMFASFSQPDRVTDVFLSALDSARLAGRASLFETLERGASALARAGRANELAGIREAMTEVERWWSLA